MNRTILALVLLAGCDQPSDPAPTAREQCIEWLACFQECAWGPYEGTAPPTALGCLLGCNYELDYQLPRSETDAVEGADGLAQGSWFKLASGSSQCAPDDADCLAWRREQLEEAILRFAAAEQAKAALCVPYKEEV